MTDTSLIALRDKVLASYYSSITSSPMQSNVTVQCPWDINCGASCTVDEFGMFECSTCGRTGLTVADYVGLIEGVSDRNKAMHFKALLDDRIPVIADLDQWHRDLLMARNSITLNLLENERGLLRKTIIDFKIGVNPKNELVIPIPNATGNGYAGAFFLKIENGLLSDDVKSVGGVAVWGFHPLRNSPAGSLVVCVRDIVDALVLQQNGILTVGLPKGRASWDQNLSKYFDEKNVILYFSDSTDDNLLSSTLLNDLLENAKSIKNVVYTTGLLTNRLLHLSDYFTKNGKTTKDFMDAGKSFNTVPKGNKEILAEIHNEKINPIKTQRVRAAQDFVNGRLSYAIIINKQPYLLDAVNGALKLEDLEANGIELSNVDFPASKFSATGIGDYLQRTQRADAASIYSSLREHLKKYVFMKNNDVYTVLTLWIMGTYVFRLFRQFPYLHVSAEKGSGKSVLMELMSRLAFNGMMVTDPSKATLYHEVELNSSSMFIDEVEQLNTVDKSTFQALMSILNSGFSKTGTTARISGGKSKEYSTYSPKMFAGIEEISDTLSDRSIKIRMLKKKKDESTAKYRLTQAIEQFETNRRDDLYIFGLNEIATLAHKYEVESETLPYLQELENRELDRWLPVLIIAEIVDSARNDGKLTVLDSALNYLKEDQYIHSVGDLEESQLTHLLEALKDLMKLHSPAKKNGSLFTYANHDVYEFFKQRKEFKSIKTLNALTKLLAKVGVKGTGVTNIGKAQRSYDIDADVIDDICLRYGVNFEIAIVVADDTQDKAFVPKRIIVTPRAKQYPVTNTIIRNVKTQNPKVEIIDAKNGNPELPTDLVAPDKIHEYLRETIVLSERSDEYLLTFPSPGDIVEEMNTMCRVATRCPLDCEFCYLQLAGGGSTVQWRRYYVDIDRVKGELAVEKLVHRTNLTLWTAISFFLKKPLEKVYYSNVKGSKSFDEISNETRKYFAQKDSKIEKDADAKEYLKHGLAKKFMELGIPLTDTIRFSHVNDLIPTFYNENAKKHLWVNIGEYTDLVAIDSVYPYFDHFMQILREDSDYRFTVYTKSAHIDNLMKHDPKKHVRITLNLNTERVINEYEHGTASLSRRIEAVKKLLETKKYLIDLSIEPFLVYENYESEYRMLMERIKQEIDISDTNLKTIKLGGVRYRRALATEIQKNHPSTTLFNDTKILVDPTGTDERLRYSVELRTRMYMMFIDAFRPHREKLILGCEFPDIWKKVGLDWEEYMSQFVYQYGNSTKHLCP